MTSFLTPNDKVLLDIAFDLQKEYTLYEVIEDFSAIASKHNVQINLVQDIWYYLVGKREWPIY